MESNDVDVLTGHTKVGQALKRARRRVRSSHATEPGGLDRRRQHKGRSILICLGQAIKDDDGNSELSYVLFFRGKRGN